MLQIRQGYLKNIFKEYQNIVLFGAGTLTTAMFEAYKGLAFEKKVNFILDNDSGKDGKTILIHGKEIPMISIERFSQLKLENYALIIMPVFMLDIVKQLDTLPAFDGVPTYIYAFLMNQKEGIPFSFRSTKEPRIPKTIHYLWFGGKELPDKYKKTSSLGKNTARILRLCAGMNPTMIPGKFPLCVRPARRVPGLM